MKYALLYIHVLICVPFYYFLTWSISEIGYYGCREYVIISDNRSKVDEVDTFEADASITIEKISLTIFYVYNLQLIFWHMYVLKTKWIIHLSVLIIMHSSVIYLIICKWKLFKKLEQTFINLYVSKFINICKPNKTFNYIYML